MGWRETAITTVLADAWFFTTYYSPLITHMIGTDWFLITQAIILIALGIAVRLGEPVTPLIGLVAMIVVSITALIQLKQYPWLTTVHAPPGLDTLFIASAFWFMGMLIYSLTHLIIANRESRQNQRGDCP